MLHIGKKTTLWEDRESPVLRHPGVKSGEVPISALSTSHGRRRVMNAADVFMRKFKAEGMLEGNSLTPALSNSRHHELLTSV